MVNLIGNDGVKPSYWEIAPGAANAAGQNLTMSLAGQYGKDKISFVAVNPGTGAHRALGRPGAGDVARHEICASRRRTSSRRRGSRWGASPKSRRCADLVRDAGLPLVHFVNGTMIEIDGGQEKSLMDRLRDR